MAHARLHARGPFYPIEFMVGLKHGLLDSCAAFVIDAEIILSNGT
jgi:hypothetical protein